MPIRQYMTLLLLSCVLVLLSPAHSEMSISASSSLDTFDYDLDNIHLKLEKLNARWQLSPTGAGKLNVDQLKAKRLTITLRQNTGKANSPPPNRIQLPFPISVKHAEIAEIIIIDANERKTLNHVLFDFEGDNQTLRLKLAQASTAFGDAQGNIVIQTAKPFALSGSLALKQTHSSTPYDVKTQISGNLELLKFETSALLTMQDNTLKIVHSGNTAHAVAHIEATGQVSLAGDYPINLKAHITELHPDQLFATNLLAHLQANLALTAQGKLLPTPTFSLQFTSNNSQWQNKAISLSGNAEINDNQVQQLELLATMANNHFKASGHLGLANSRLEWQASFEDLSSLNANYSGTINADGSMIDSLDNPSLQFKLLANKLNLNHNLTIENLAGNLELAASDHGKVAGNLSFTNMKYGQNPAINGKLTIDGLRNQHTISLLAENKAQKIETTLQGGLSSTNQWQGWLQNLAYAALAEPNKTDKNQQVTLKTPAPLTLSSDALTLEKATLQLSTGVANIDYFKVDKSGLISQGYLAKVSLNDLPPALFTLPTTLQGNPTFSAKWDIHANENFNGNIKLWHEDGDLNFIDSNGTSKPLGLKNTHAELAITNNQVTSDAFLNGDNLGELKAKLSTTLNKTDSGYALLANTPLILDGSAHLNTLSWLPLPKAFIGAQFDGKIDATVHANGTASAPNLSGNVHGQDIQLSLASEGVALSQGILQASFEQNQLTIHQATWHGGDGQLSADGKLWLADKKPKIDLNWTANKFTVISRADRLLTINGTGKTTLDDDLLSIFGNFNVEKGLIELATESTPSLGDDVVILGEANTVPKSSLQILLNGLRIDLGKDFTLRGQGLDAQLQGAVTLTGLTQYHPHTDGSIQVKQGTYMAYGQVLNIERGIFNFSGAMDNPGLNIRAMRNSKPINAGIEITGSALIPLTKLVSDPEVPESEKLSWLVLGHGMESAGKNDYGMLSLAAGVLLSQGQSVPLQTQLARAAGLDEFTFAGGDAESASLVFGKRLSAQLYLSYEKSISGLLDVARLTFNMTNRWSLRAEAGTESAVDVLYTFSFK
ncbi:MAG: hypothetical protein HOP21_10505 [Methylotenera sp.]|nr:hypothetical protein [Methylotenera sp.]